MTDLTPSINPAPAAVPGTGESVADALPVMSFRVRFTRELKACFDYVSPHALVLTGYAPEQIRENSALLLERFHPEDEAAWTACVAAMQANRSDCRFEARYRHKDGHFVAVRAEARCDHASDGSFRAVGCWFDSATELRGWAGLAAAAGVAGAKIPETIAEAPNAQADLYRALIENTLIGVVVVRDDEILFANHAEARIFGFDSPEEFAAQGMNARVALEDRARMAAVRQARQRAEGVERRTEWWGLRKDGSRVWIESFADLIPWNGGRVAGGLHVDSTPRKLAEEALRASEARYRLLIHNSLQGVVISDHDSRILFANRAAAETLGYASEHALVGLLVDRVVAPADRADMRRQREARFGAEVPPVRYECRMLKSDGDAIWISYSAAATQWEGQRAVQTTFMDITERKLSELRVRNLIEASPLALIVHRDFKVLFSNEAAAAMFGYASREDMLKLPDFTVTFVPGDTERIRKRNAEQLAGLKVETHLEREALRADGSRFWVDTLVTLIDWDGEKAFLIAYVDISARKKAEEARWKSEALLQGFMDHAPAVFTVRDMNGRFEMVNRQFLRRVNLTAEQVLGKSLREVLAPEVADEIEPNVRQVLSTGKPQIFEEIAQRPDGSRCNLASRFPLFDRNGQITGVGSITIDVTPLKEAELALRESESRYRAVVENSLQGIMVGSEDRVVFANEALARIFGYPSPEAMIGLDPIELYAPETHAATKARKERLLAGEPLGGGERMCQRADGSTVWVYSQPVGIQWGGKPAVLISYADVSERKVAQEAVERGRRILFTMMNALPNPIYLKDREGRYMLVNEAMCRDHGMTKDQLLGRTVAELGFESPEQAEEIMAVDRRVVEQGVPMVIPEIKVSLRTGQTQWQHHVKVPYRNDTGEVVGIVGLLMDITDRKLADEALRESREHLATVLDMAPDALITTDRIGTIRTFNRAAERIFGWTRDEAIGKNARILVPREDGERYAQLVEKYLRAGVPTVQEIGPDPRGRRKDGSTFPIMLRVGEVRREGEVNFTLIVADITQRKRAEEALRESRAYLTAVLDLAPEAILTVDEGLKIETVNRKIEQMFGYDRDELVGRDVYILAPEPDRARYIARLNAHLADPEVNLNARHGDGFQPEGRRKDGGTFPIYFRSGAVRRGGQTTFTVIIADATRQREHEAQLRELARTKSSMLSNLTHELRTPITAILGFAQLLRSEKNLTDTQREDLRVIEQSTHHLLELVNDVLDAQKLEAGVVHLTKEPFDLYRAMEMLMGMFRPRCEAKGILARLEIEPGVPQYALGDERKLRQVLINLVGNAIKFTDQGGIAIKLDSPDGCIVRFTVEDTGVGIRPEDFVKVGKPFEQGSSERGGTGLGLTISKGLIELMGGTMIFDSNYGAGTTFTFELPLADSDYN